MHCQNRVVHPSPSTVQGELFVSNETVHKLLVAEDREADFALLNRYLQRAFPAVETINARNVQQVETLLKEQQFDCLILDYVLGPENGLQLLTSLRDEGNDAPVIVMSAHGDERVAVQAMKAGAQDYLPKSMLSPEMLEVAINGAMHQVKLEREVKAQQQELERLTQELKETNQELQRLTRIDALTQIANRRHFNESLAQEARRSNRRGPLSLILIDIDQFKLYNDYYGHPEGDACLQRVAQTLAQCARRSGDVVARYGGEEFALILPATDIQGAIRIAEEARTEIANLQIPHATSTVEPFVTISAGVATGNGSGAILEALVSQADEAMYEAKESGRNRVVSAHEYPATSELA